VFVLGMYNSVGIVTRYGLDGPGMKPRWGLDFPHLSRPALWSIQAPVQWVPDLFSGDKAAGKWRLPPTPCSTEFKERVELYLCPHSPTHWAFMMCSRVKCASLMCMFRLWKSYFVRVLLPSPPTLITICSIVIELFHSVI